MRHDRYTTLTDADGATHQYVLTQHGASEGFDMLPRLVEIAGEPILVAVLGNGDRGGVDLDLDEVKGLIKAGMENDKSDKEDKADMVAEFGQKLVMSLRGDVIGAQLTTVCRRLMVAGGSKLFLELLKYTQRDGLPLGNVTHFDTAYQGNYGELFAAVKWAFTENFAGAIGVLKDPTSPAAK